MDVCTHPFRNRDLIKIISSISISWKEKKKKNQSGNINSYSLSEGFLLEKYLQQYSRATSFTCNCSSIKKQYYSTVIHAHNYCMWGKILPKQLKDVHCEEDAYIWYF